MARYTKEREGVGRLASLPYMYIITHYHRKVNTRTRKNKKTNFKNIKYIIERKEANKAITWGRIDEFKLEKDDEFNYGVEIMLNGEPSYIFCTERPWTPDS